MKINDTFDFNTGRYYSGNGQPIRLTCIAINRTQHTAAIGDEYAMVSVKFNDYARGIVGVVELLCDDDETIAEQRDAVVAQYDAGRYELAPYSDEPDAEPDNIVLPVAG